MVSFCNECKLQIQHLRGKEGLTLMPFYQEHRLCTDKHTEIDHDVSPEILEYDEDKKCAEILDQHLDL